MKSKALLIAAVLSMGVAHAAFKDGNKLYSQMTSGVDADWFTAMGYITGVLDATHNEYHCAPGNVTAGQAFDMVRRHMAAYPERRHVTAETIVIYVASTAWPCKKGNTL